MKTITCLALLAAAAPTGNGAIVLSGNFNTGTPTPTLTFTEDIIFNVTGNGNIDKLVFDDWVPAEDGSNSFVLDSPAQSLAYSLDGSSSLTTVSSLIDNQRFTTGSLSPLDGFLLFESFAVTNGQTLTINAGSYTFGSNASFNPALNGVTFTGEVFLVGGSTRLSNNGVTVPEPSAALLAALSSLALLRRKRA